jgi:hypothetical protein
MGTKFYPIPNVALYPANPTQAQLDQQIKEWTDLEKLGLIKNAEVFGFANAEHLKQRLGWGPYGSGPIKTWWLDQYRAMTGIWIEQDASGRWLSDPNPGPGGTIEGAQYTKIQVYNHARNYHKHQRLRVFPKLRPRTIDADEAVRQHVRNGPGIPPPLAQVFGTMGKDFSTSWNDKVGICIHPDDPTVAEAYLIAEFEAEFPIETSVHVPTGDSMEISARVSRARSVVNSSRPASEIDTELRSIYAPKGTFTGGGFAG